MEVTKERVNDFCRINLKLNQDDRGFFTRIFCAKELEKLKFCVTNVNESFSKKAFTFRGFHCQFHPFHETKLIRCLSGSLINTIVDLRVKSTTFGHFVETTLQAGDSFVNVVPPGFGNSVLTLEEDTRMLYLTDNFYSLDHEVCLNYKSYFISKDVREKIVEISSKDRNSKVISSVEELYDYFKVIKFDGN